MHFKVDDFEAETGVSVSDGARLLGVLNAHLESTCVTSVGDKASLEGSEFEPYSADVEGFAVK